MNGAGVCAHVQAPGRKRKERESEHARPAPHLFFSLFTSHLPVLGRAPVDAGGLPHVQVAVFVTGE